MKYLYRYMSHEDIVETAARESAFVDEEKLLNAKTRSESYTLIDVENRCSHVFTITSEAGGLAKIDELRYAFRSHYETDRTHTHVAHGKTAAAILTQIVRDRDEGVSVKSDLRGFFHELFTALKLRNEQRFAYSCTTVAELDDEIEFLAGGAS